jgi:hypothetical protein
VAGERLVERDARAFFYKFYWKMECLKEILPTGRVGGCEEGDINEKGVVDRVVLDKRGPNTIDMGIALVDFATPALGKEAG